MRKTTSSAGLKTSDLEPPSFFATEAEDDSDVRAVAFTSLGKGAVKENLDRPDLVEAFL